MILGSFRYLHTTWTCSAKLFMKWLSSCGGMSIFSFNFLHLCWPTPQQLTVVRLVSSGPCSDTYTLPEHTPQNHSGNGWAFVEVKSLSIFDFSPFCSPTVQDLCGIFLHDPRLLWIPIHSLKNPHQTVRFLLRNVKFYFCLFDMIFTNCPALTLAHFTWSQALLDTYALCEDTPWNHLWNGYVLVEVCQIQISFFPFLWSGKNVCHHFNLWL